MNLWITIIYLNIKSDYFSDPLESITENSGKEFIDISELPADEESIDQSESR